ncbi:MAG: hypothetical protein OXQ94_18405 [Gemmatimonadota bacterium]|nr:hypothetical protein [Gemmatimonadota bacterium]MDE2873647.1 hypothetical protein [Gemmatimonadota bacterium]
MRYTRHRYGLPSFLERERTLLRVSVDPLPAYVADVAGRFRPVRPVRAVVDCGNGAGSAVAVDVLRAAGLEVVPLVCESHATFPNHHPDPTVDEYVQDLIAAVRSHGAEVGIGWLCVPQPVTTRLPTTLPSQQGRR